MQFTLVVGITRSLFLFNLSINTMHPMLNVAVKAARRAGTVINRASLNLERLQVDRKQHNLSLIHI